LPKVFMNSAVPAWRATLFAVNRALTDRERAVLDALLAVEFEGVAALREQARTARVVGMCDCGCPSITFETMPGLGMWIVVNAGVRGSADGLFLFTRGDRLGGIDYLCGSEEPVSELPDPSKLDIHPA
jgi:hypothetical protein